MKPSNGNPYRPLDKCIDCKRCMQNCPMLLRHCDKPTDLFNQPDRLTADDGIVAFSCTLCGYCDQVCPTGVSLKSRFFDIKQDLINKNGYPKAFGKRALDFHQTNGFSATFATNLSADAPQNTTRPVRRVFFPGCNISAGSPSLVQSVYDYLNEYEPTEVLMKCCGSPTYTTGQKHAHGQMNASLVADFEALGVEEVVVLCMNCRNRFLEHIPGLVVKTIWEVMLEDGLPPLTLAQRHVIDQSPVFALHDPCPTRHAPGVLDAVRTIIHRYDIPMEEFQLNRTMTVCCGSGAMLPLVDMETAKSHMKARANQTKSKNILTYCGECVQSMEVGGKPSVHLLDLIFSERSPLLVGTPNPTALQRWWNRFLVKRWVDKARKKLSL